MGVKSELIKKAVERKDIIRRILELEGGHEEEVGNVWVDYTPKKLKDFRVGAVDGSRNHKDFLGFTVYAISSVSKLFANGKLENRESFTVDVDVLKPHEFSDSRLSMLMGILEAKEALKLLKDGADAVLIDGSFIGNVIRPAVFSFELSKEERESVTKIFEELRRSFPADGIGSKNFYGEVLKISREKFAALCGYLEYLEYLHSLSLLAEFTERIISISKTSTSRLYGFKSVLPDIAIFNASDLPVGFSKPVEITMDRELKRGFPEVFEDTFRKLRFKTSYVRFGKNGNVYKVESGMDTERVMDMLSAYIVSGYPYPLRVAHEDAKIDSRDMKRLISIISPGLRTGREGLGE